MNPVATLGPVRGQPKREASLFDMKASPNDNAWPFGLGAVPSP
ncbi:hypothetical protein PSN_2758 [Pseudomonas sp. NGC7]